MLSQPLAIALGGALGALLRWGLANGVHAVLGRAFPYGTLVVNVLGCLLIGVLFVLLVERLDLAAVWRGAILIGLLGGFTTFSTFTLETLTLLESGAWMRAGLNVFGSVILCLVATWGGILFGRAL